MSTQSLLKLDSLQIMKLIPHRYPFLWVDTVEIKEIGKWAIGKKAVSISESLFQGHFPNQPIFPGVLIIEALAQTGAVLLNHEVHNQSSNEVNNDCGYLARVDVKFLLPVTPGSVIHLSVRKTGQMNNLFMLNCVAEVDGQKVAEGKISVSHPAGKKGHDL